MLTAISQQRTRRLVMVLALGALIYLTYLLAFSGNITSDDERYIIDTADTIAIQDEPFLNQTTYLRGLQRTDVEPAQPLLSVPLYWLAYHTPWVGNVHALFLFNPIVTTLTAILLFFYALDLGYQERTALVAALLFGLTTIVVPYARTYFREPLSMLSLLAAAFCLQHWRQKLAAGEKRHWLWLVLGVVTTLLALLSKEAALVALPALLLLALPEKQWLKKHLREIVVIVVVLALIAVLFTLGLEFYREHRVVLAERFQITKRWKDFRNNLPHAWYGAAGYLVSPGKSIWMFSPVLILALGGPFVLPRRRWRESWLFLITTLLYAFIYAAVRRETWYGGADWGARYMVPLVPFLMVAALPLLDRMLNSGRLWPRVLLFLLAVWGFVIQVVATYVNVHSYYSYMQAHTGEPPWTGPAIWGIRWSQTIGSLLYAPQAAPDIIWLIPTPDWWAIGAILLGLMVAAGLLALAYRREVLPRRLAVSGMILAPLLALGLSLFALARAYDDPRYLGDDQALHEMRIYLSEHAGREDAIFLSSPNYVLYFMNYYKGEATWYSLPLSPGEVYSPDQELEVASERPQDLIALDSISLIYSVMPYQLLFDGAPVWVVLDHSSFVTWSTRPVEWWMTQNAFPASARDFGPNARLVQYVPLFAPKIDAEPAHPVGARFGDSIYLVGFDLLVEEWYASLDDLHPGDKLGVSLLWQSLKTMQVDYTVAVYLLNAEGQPVLQQDRPPEDGFAPTTSWRPGKLTRDNFGFILPSDLPPGEYQIWTVIYSWPSLERLPVTGPDGADWGDHVMLETITIR
jgi:4-amino-4-deoxy-L-arabinose transferase-like glycosyltransferase